MRGWHVSPEGPRVKGHHGGSRNVCDHVRDRRRIPFRRRARPGADRPASAWPNGLPPRASAPTRSSPCSPPRRCTSGPSPSGTGSSSTGDTSRPSTGTCSPAPATAFRRSIPTSIACSPSASTRSTAACPPTCPPTGRPRIEVEAYVTARARGARPAARAAWSSTTSRRARWKMAIEHRLMHAETLAYMLPHLPLDAFAEGAAAPPAEQDPGPGALLASGAGYERTGAPGTPRRVTIPAGCVTLGRARAGGGFGWDNEYEEDVVDVPAFTIDARNVTNGEFLAFVEAGGYGDRAARSGAHEDWAWRAEHGRRAPDPVAPGARPEARCQRMAPALHLRRGPARPLDLPGPGEPGRGAGLRALAGPARCRPKPQFHRAAYGTPERHRAALPVGRRGAGGRCAWQLRFRALGSRCRSARYPAGDSAFGVADLVGNGWEWTRHRVRAVPGLQPPTRSTPATPSRSSTASTSSIKGGSPRTDRVLPAALVPQLVPAALPVRLRRLPLRRRIPGPGSLTMVRSLASPVATSRSPRTCGRASTRPGQKELPSKYLYDDVGSALFETISLLPEYGLTRADARLLCARTPTRSSRRMPRPTLVAELGSGQRQEDALRARGAGAARSRCSTSRSTSRGRRSAQSEKELGAIERVERRSASRPSTSTACTPSPAPRAPGQKLLVLFLGSTIGNFDRPAGEAFLRPGARGRCGAATACCCRPIW